MKRISSSVTKIKNRYDVVVIGSGYGGGVTASRMARAGKQVCVLERGKEFLPGDFPDTALEAASEFQVGTKGVHVGDETALFDMCVNDEMNVLVGCGLGGTSLINANVSIQADSRVFDEAVWPKAFIADLDTKLKEGFTRAQRMLKPNPYPEDTKNFPVLKKTEAMRKSGQQLGDDTYLLPINVNFKTLKKGINHVGVSQAPCNLCGDCVSGCNYTAKNTVQMTYLPDAKNHGAEIFTKTKVSHISYDDGKWKVHFSVAGNSSDKFDSPDQFVIADVVVLSAGSLGSTEILLRSKEKGLSVSDNVGKNFTGNGDVVSFAYNTDQKINGIGKGTRQLDPENPAGPCITTIIDTRKSSEDFRDGMSIEEGVLPGALAPLLSTSLAGIAALTGTDTDDGFIDALNEKKRIADSLFRGAYHGAINNTLTSLTMAHDSASGEMSLVDDKLRISWPGLGDEPVFTKVKEKMTAVTQSLGGTFLPNPLSHKITGNDQITVHPLGGCPMADDASTGVVNHKGQVFTGTTGSEAYDSLYVADGSIIPMSLGTNPLFTITAISERNAKLMAKDHGWKYSVKLPSKPMEGEVDELQEKVGIQFTEVMAGFVSEYEITDYAAAYQKGEAKSDSFRFTLTVVSNDLDNMLESESHEAAMYGTVEAPLLSDRPLTVTNGVFNLFVKSTDKPSTRLMKYQIKMTTENGDVYFMRGFKSIRDEPGLDMWADTTTLFITLYKDEISDEQIIAKGLLKIAPIDFATQLTTMKVSNANSILERLRYTSKFGSFFAGQLFQTFGGIASRLGDPSADDAIRKKRVLSAPVPEVYSVKTTDDKILQLTRFNGGAKGAVLMVYGAEATAPIFNSDLCNTNLVEYLAGHQYDIWLLGFQDSMLGKYDIPEAIEKVLAINGGESVNIVAHHTGMTSAIDGILDGSIQKVRSATFSQASSLALEHDYQLTKAERIKLPITFIGEVNENKLMPENFNDFILSLKKLNGDHWYKMVELSSFDKDDRFCQETAVRDIYPHVLKQLQNIAQPTATVEKAPNATVTEVEKPYSTSLQPNLFDTLGRMQKDDGHDYEFLCSQCESSFELILSNVLENARSKHISTSLLAKIGLGDLAWIQHLNNDYHDMCEPVEKIKQLIPNPDEAHISQRPDWPETYNVGDKTKPELWRPLTWGKWAVTVSNKILIPNIKPSIVFGCIQNSQSWGKFYANIEDVSVNQLDNVDSLFTFRTFDTKFDAEVIIFRKLGEVLSIGWRAKAAFGAELLHRWDIYQDPNGGSIVTTELHQRGIKSMLVSRSLHSALEINLQNWLYGIAVSAKRSSKAGSENPANFFTDSVETSM